MSIVSRRRCWWPCALAKSTLEKHLGGRFPPRAEARVIGVDKDAKPNFVFVPLAKRLWCLFNKPIWCRGSQKLYCRPGRTSSPWIVSGWISTAMPEIRCWDRRALCMGLRHFVKPCQGLSRLRGFSESQGSREPWAAISNRFAVKKVAFTKGWPGILYPEDH